MTDRSILRCCIGAGILFCASCFDGRDALGLPCEEEFQCGNGQVCVDGTCAWPGDGTGGGSGTPSDTDPGDDSSSFVGCDGEERVVGDFTSRDITIADSGNAMSVAVGSFSGPGQTEIAVLTRDPAQVALFVFADAEFVRRGLPITVESEPMDLAAGDLDGDGLDDLVVVDANGMGASLTLLWGDEDAPLEVSTTSETNIGIAFSVAIGNVTGDGKQIVVSSGSQTAATFLFTVLDRAPTLSSQLSGVSDSPWDTVVAELYGGAPAEILIAGSNDAGLDGIAGSDEVHVVSATDGPLSRRQGLLGIRSPFGVDAGDLDGDGIPELVVVGKNIDPQTSTPEESSNTSQIARCEQTSDGGDYVCEVWDAGEDRQGFGNVRLADLDCDGVLDVVIGTSGDAEDAEDGAMFVAFGPLEVGFATGSLALAASGAVGNRIEVADVTNDGRPDVIVPLFGPVGAGSSTVRVYSFEEPS